MKRILYLSNAVIPTEASRSLSIMRVCQALTDAGHRVMLSAIAPSKKHDDPVSYYGLRGGFSIQCDYFNRLFYNNVTCWYLRGGLIHAWKTRSLFRSFKPDLVYSRLTILELAFVPRKIPIIFEMHSLGALGQKWWRRIVFRWITRCKNIRRIIVTTNILADLLKKEFPNIEIVIARLSAEPPIEIASGDLDNFRENNLLGSFKQNVGYTGFLDTYGLRGTDIICQAAAQMPNVGFHIVGGDPAAVEHWKNYAEEWNNHGNIFFYGYRNPAEMPFFLNVLDVVLAPLQYRPNKRAPVGQNMSPLKLPQYMGYAQAIVASDLSAHREVLEHKKTALLVQHNDVDAWVSSIQSLLDSPQTRQKFGEAAYNAYAAEFTPEQRIKKILEGI